MKHKNAKQLIDDIHKNKNFRPDEDDRKFLEDLSFCLTFDNIKVSEKTGRRLWAIYAKSEEVQ